MGSTGAENTSAMLHGLDGGVRPLPFDEKLWLGLGMSWLFFKVSFLTLCFYGDNSMYSMHGINAV